MTASSVSGSSQASVSRVQQRLRDARRQRREIRHRQRRHEHAGVDEQPHPRVVERSDVVDRARDRRRIGCLSDPAAPRRESGPARAARAAVCAAAPVRPARSAAARPPRRGRARCATAGGGMRAARRRRADACGLSQSSRLAPTMLTRPPAAASRSRSSVASAVEVDGNDRHNCPGSSSTTGETPEVTMPTAMSVDGRSARITSGVQLKALAASVHGVVADGLHPSLGFEVELERGIRPAREIRDEQPEGQPGRCASRAREGGGRAARAGPARTTSRRRPAASTGHSSPSRWTCTRETLDSGRERIHGRRRRTSNPSAVATRASSPRIGIMRPPL